MKKYLVIFGLIIFDQFIKFIVMMYVAKPITIINNFFDINYVKNYGISFSILSGKLIIIIMVSIFAIGLIMYLIHYYRYNSLYQIGLIMMLSGAIGNFIDRFIHGFVVDYLDFTIFGYDFAVFNFADTLLVCGAIFLGLTLVVEEMRKKDEKTNSN